MKFRPHLILVDGSSYLFRAFHALPPLTSSKGEATGAIYGVINMLRKLINDYPSEWIAVIFDSPGKTFRDDLYPEYKATRGETPDELRSQIQPLYELIQAMGLPLIIEEGVEADDVIATLAQWAKDKNRKVLISTGDKDLAQLVDDEIVLINTMTGNILDKTTVPEKFGVHPHQIIDYLTLVGDNIDNIPGVPNVGPKTAAKWLQAYGSLDELLKHANDIKGKVGENLRAHRHHLPLSKSLVTLKKDVFLKESWEDLKLGAPDHQKLLTLFKRFEFRNWLSELLKQTKAEQNLDHYETILTEDHLQKWIEALKQAPVFAFDTETSDLNVMRADLVGLSFSTQAGKAAYIPFTHSYLGAPIQLKKAEVLEKLRPIFESPQKTAIAQNIKFDMKMLMNEGLWIQNKFRDTQLASYVLNSSNRHDLDTLALKYLGYQTITYEDVAGTGVKQISFDEVPIERAAPYAAEDADVALQLDEILWPKIQENSAFEKVYQEIEIPLVAVLAKMEYHGVLIDAEKLEQQSQEIAERLTVLEQEAYSIANCIFNLSSTKQLQEVLYEKLQLPVLSKTPKGAPSTAEDALLELAANFPLPKIILEHRSLSKLKSTYTDTLPKEINPKTGRVHTSYYQTGTSTGRLSSANPNLQNIPVRNEEGRKIRKAFIAPPGYKIISADYSQIELRLMAHLTQDKNLIRAFENGHDIHTSTASEVFHTPIEEVTSEQRRSAKAINFGIIYGMSAFGLSKQLGIPQTLAKNYIDLYFSRYPEILNYMNNTRVLAHQQGYVETIFGRRLYLAEINNSNLQKQKAMERAAINAPLQGSAADIIKLAMIRMDQFLSQGSVEAAMIMQVHDELVFEVAGQDVPIMMAKIKEIMEQEVQLSVPLLVSVNVGNNWDEAH